MGQRDHSGKKLLNQRDRHILEAMTDGYVALDREWRFTYVNRVIAKATGKTPAQLVGRRLPDEFPEAWALIERHTTVIHSGQSVAFDAEYPPLGVHFHVKTFPTPEGVEVFFQDITSFRHARRNASRLLNLTESLNAATHLDQVLKTVLQHLQEETYGVLVALHDPEEDVLKVRYAVNFDPSVVQPYLRIASDAAVPLAEAFRTGRLMVMSRAECEARYPALAIDPQTQEIVVLPLRSSGRVLGSLALSMKQPWAVDLLTRSKLTVVAAQCASAIERAQLFEEARRNEGLYRTLLETTHAVIWEVDAEFRVTRPLRTWEYFTGQPFEQHRDFGYMAAVHPADQQAASDELQAQTALGHSFKMRVRLHHHSGQFRATEVQCVPVQDESGQVCGWVGAIRDVSEQERQLRWEGGARQLLAQLGQATEALSVYRDALQAVADIAGTPHALMAGPLDSAGALSGTFRVLHAGQIPARILSHLRQFQAAPESSVGRAITLGLPFWLHDELPDPTLPDAVLPGVPGTPHRSLLSEVGPVLLVPLNHEHQLTALIALNFTGHPEPGQDVLEHLRWLQPQLAPALQRAHLLRTLERSERQAQTTLRALDEGVLLFDAAGNVVAANPAAYQLTGLGLDVQGDHSGGVGGSGTAVFPSAFDTAWGLRDPAGQLLPVSAYPAAHVITTGETVRDAVIEFVRPDGRAILVSINAVPLAEDGVFRGAVVSFADVTEAYRMRQQLERQAREDELTGLPNRRVFNWSLEQLAREPQAKTAVLLLDIDQFKTVNDTFGHHVGDSLLQAVARRLTEVCEGRGTVIRLAGDEFGVLLPIVREEEAGQMATLLLERLAETLDVADMEFHVSVCVGICISPDEGAAASELYRQVDLALHEAKRIGAGNWCLFTPDLSAIQERRVRLERRLRAALQAQNFLPQALPAPVSHQRALHAQELLPQGLSVHYQPIVSLLGRQAVAFEALARWHDPELGWVSPLEFIRVAEESGLIHELGALVLHCALRQGKAWAQAWNKPVSISVNVSSTQLMSCDFLEQVLGALEATGAAASSLILEITEAVVIQDMELVNNRLQALRDLGMRVALDDFGTGFSSLAVLGTLPIDVLKVDRLFVKGVAQHTRRQALLAAVILLGHRLGIMVVAEGVEEISELEVLQILGCTHVQGYLFARPLPAAEIKGVAHLAFAEQAVLQPARQGDN
ncbi:EAL domain-containing protein [Deinococcus sp. Arct2-2]|uniref:EAL domain-containing protein n=1 Tax=Deinococcus sp. Arct2-2 TaxID=2568653 RepID=UPI0010A4D41A|nr:EAL domain-containing protein [Deinococcus sp. Arct2-2]THF71683.1 EAL domain-containing protein [Deinococcus sp. Arct2-2]